MAELPIERKEGRNWIPLVLLGLLLLAILGYCATRGEDDVIVPADTAAGVGAVGDTALGGAAAGVAGSVAGGGAAAGGAVAQFAEFVAARDTSAETEANHQYTATGTRLLAAALDELAGAENRDAIQVYADSMRGSIDRLQRSGAEDRHADDARAAFNAAVSAMESIDRARGRTNDVAPMRAIARELSPEQPLVPQLGVVHRFFEAARDALQRMQPAS